MGLLSSFVVLVETFEERYEADVAARGRTPVHMDNPDAGRLELQREDVEPEVDHAERLAEQRFEGHWITVSARMRTDWGIVRPMALAVLRLMTSSNVVGCSTGRSAGLAPFRILST